MSGVKAMTESRQWTGDWTWRVGANSKVGMAYRPSEPADVILCDHRHRSIDRAVLCGRTLAEAKNEVRG